MSKAHNILANSRQNQGIEQGTHIDSEEIGAKVWFGPVSTQTATHPASHQFPIFIILDNL
ncbi:hypothetical protein [Nitrosomonas sp. Is37]|uniref:hypothetical protein n=1 Tax=Nitrosomonas sp. Is37 TaxID=3080535 RepID=UPI00294ADD65|nr:hypothetical protein [Nitrosomonas sp. Is37]MDV6345547.1 hypothetical protein [Nitrosomonas sp. Is37]